MVYSTTSGGYWVLFPEHAFTDPRILFCPSENNPKFMYDTAQNPWPALGTTPTVNVQAGYADRPQTLIPDDLLGSPSAVPPFTLPKLHSLGHEAILADLTASQI